MYKIKSQIKSTNYEKFDTHIFYVIFTTGIFINAQGQSFQDGDLIINAGIGLGSTFVFAGGLGLPLGGGMEYGVPDAILKQVYA